jgi:hypothetical protein
MDSYKKMLRSGSHPTSLKEGCAEMCRDDPTGRDARDVGPNQSPYLFHGRKARLMRNDCCPFTETRSRSIQIEESTLKEIRELCHQMSNSNGMVTAQLTVGLRKNPDTHIQVMESALGLSIRGTEALRKLMLLLGTLEESFSAAAPTTERSGTITFGNESRE